MHPISRRDWLRTAAAGAAALAISSDTVAADATGFTLPPLPYPANALEAAIDAKTMEIHHGKHHAAYVKNLNDALADQHPHLLKLPLDANCSTGLNEYPNPYGSRPQQRRRARQSLILLANHEPEVE